MIGRSRDISSKVAFSRPSFQLAVRPSKIFNAGRGVICQGSVKAGSLVGFYPGPYYPPPPLYSVVNADGDICLPSKSIFKMINVHERVNASYQIHCNRNGGYMDALTYDYENPQASSYAVGHLINHPPASKLPNVRMVDFKWGNVHDSSQDDENGSIWNTIQAMNPIADGVWFIDSSTGKPVFMSPNCAPLVGLAIIATNDIQNEEELFLDYAYDESDDNLPDWYNPVQKPDRFESPF